MNTLSAAAFLSLIAMAASAGQSAVSPEDNIPVDIYVSDNFATGHSETRYVRAIDGVPCDDMVRTRGAKALRAMRPSAAGEGCSSTGNQNVAVIVANFPGQRPPSIANSTLQQLMFGAMESTVNTWYEKASYGKVSLSGQVFGPYTLDRQYSCDDTAAMRTAAIRAADRDIDFNRFQRFILLFPTISGCQFGGLSTLGCVTLQSNEGSTRGSWVWANYNGNNEYLRLLLIHELGHSLGIGHSRMQRFPGVSIEADDFRALPLEYGDLTSVMGAALLGGDIAAPQKTELGWIDRETDIASATEDGDFTLVRLDHSTGTRGLRVRREVQPDSSEWLWIEYRPDSRGVLVRRDTVGSNYTSDLLDLTPATLDEAAGDPDYASESHPELQANSTWSDPHSDLVITTGSDAGGDDIRVSVRYLERCAIPAVRQITLPVATRETTIEVIAQEGCEWTAISGRTWISAEKSGENQVRLKISEAPDAANRSGVVTIGRHAVSIQQLGPPKDMEVTTVSLPGPDIPLNAAFPLIFGMRDENGLDDLQTVYLAVRSVAGGVSQPCYFRYSYPDSMLKASSDGGETFQASGTADAQTSGACAASALPYTSGSNRYLRLELTLNAVQNQTVNFKLSADDSFGVRGPEIDAGTFTATSRCLALPEFPVLEYFFVTAAANQGVPVRTTDPSCPWSATSDVPWIGVASTTGIGPATLRFNLSANPDQQVRQGAISINGAAVQVIQAGSDIQPRFVRMLPSETVVSHLGGQVRVLHVYGVTGTIFPSSMVPWLRLIENRRGPNWTEAVLTALPNPEPAPRTGTVSVGGKLFTVLQEAAPVQ